MIQSRFIDIFADDAAPRLTTFLHYSPRARTPMTEMLREFLQMGGYAQYVWPPYLFAAAALAANVFAALRRRRRALQNIRRRGE